MGVMRITARCVSTPLLKGLRATRVSRVIVGSIRALNTRGIRGLDLDFSIVHTENNENLARIREFGRRAWAPDAARGGLAVQLTPLHISKAGGVALRTAFAKRVGTVSVRNRVDWARASEPVSPVKLNDTLGRPHNANEKVLEMMYGGAYAQGSR